MAKNKNKSKEVTLSISLLINGVGVTGTLSEDGADLDVDKHVDAHLERFTDLITFVLAELQRAKVSKTVRKEILD